VRTTAFESLFHQFFSRFFGFFKKKKGFTRTCEYCGKDFTNNKKENLSVVFSRHLSTHDMTALSYKEFLLERKNKSPAWQLAAGRGNSRRQSESAPAAGDSQVNDSLPPLSVGGGSNSVPGDAERDHFEFGGGFGSDGSIDAAPREAPQRLSLATALKNKTMRALFVSCEELWRDAALRQRLHLARLTMTGAMTAAAKHLPKLAKSDGASPQRITLVTEVSELASSTAGEVLEALTDLAPVETWSKALDSLKPGTAIKVLEFLTRLVVWAVVEKERQLAYTRAPGAALPHELAVGREVQAVTQRVLNQLRRSKLQQHRAKVLTRAQHSDMFAALADTVVELAEFKIGVEESLATYIAEELAELTVPELGALCLAMLVGWSDTVALRIGAGACLAGDEAQFEHVERLTVRRRDGVVYLQVVEGQKGHLMAPVNLTEHAPTAAIVLNALLDRPDFVHGTSIIGEIDGSLEEELQPLAELDGMPVPPEVLRNVSQSSDKWGRNTMRRYWITMATFGTLWRWLTVKEFSALCYLQQHEPRTALKDYMRLDGLPKLLPAAWKKLANDSQVAWQELTAKGPGGVLEQRKHETLEQYGFSARTKISELASRLASHEFVCNTCDKQVERPQLVQHLAECLGGLSQAEAVARVNAESAKVAARLAALAEADEDASAPDESFELQASDEDDSAGNDLVVEPTRGGARAAKKRALRNVDSSSPRWNSVALHATLWNERWRVQRTHRHRRVPKNSRAK
jgi:hypothetical protein